jgi:hypothetical protein
LRAGFVQFVLQPLDTPAQLVQFFFFGRAGNGGWHEDTEKHQQGRGQAARGGRVRSRVCGGNDQVGRGRWGDAGVAEEAEETGYGVAKGNQE